MVVLQLILGTLFQTQLPMKTTSHTQLYVQNVTPCLKIETSNPFQNKNLQFQFANVTTPIQMFASSLQVKFSTRIRIYKSSFRAKFENTLLNRTSNWRLLIHLSKQITCFVFSVFFAFLVFYYFSQKKACRMGFLPFALELVEWLPAPANSLGKKSVPMHLCLCLCLCTTAGPRQLPGKKGMPTHLSLCLCICMTAGPCQLPGEKSMPMHLCLCTYAHAFAKFPQFLTFQKIPNFPKQIPNIPTFSKIQSFPNFSKAFQKKSEHFPNKSKQITNLQQFTTFPKQILNISRTKSKHIFFYKFYAKFENFYEIFEIYKMFQTNPNKS